MPTASNTTYIRPQQRWFHVQSAQGTVINLGTHQTEFLHKVCHDWHLVQETIGILNQHNEVRPMFFDPPQQPKQASQVAIVLVGFGCLVIHTGFRRSVLPS
jgi:hypothetical protein